MLRVILIKISTGCVCVFIYWPVDFKIYLKIPIPTISKIIFKKQFDGLIVPDVATYFKARIIKKMWYLGKDRQIKYKVQSPETSP